MLPKPKCVNCGVMPVFFTGEEMCRGCGIALGFDSIPAAPQPSAAVAAPKPPRRSAVAPQPPEPPNRDDQED